MNTCSTSFLNDSYNWSTKFFTSFDTFVTSLYDVTDFYDTMIKNIEDLGIEYGNKDFEFYKRNMMG